VIGVTGPKRDRVIQITVGTAADWIPFELFFGEGPMKRLCCLIALMAMSSSAHANSFSFLVGGYRIRVEASRHCGSLSCASFSIPRIYKTRHKSTRQETSRQEAVAPARATAAPISVPAPPKAPAAPLEPAAPASTGGWAATSSATDPLPESAPKQEAHIPRPVIPSVEEAALQPLPLPAQLQLPARPAPEQLKSAQQLDLQPDTPLGDWRTEGNKAAVRIKHCGQGLCGYVLDPATETIGITVLINMKLSTGTSWSGSIFSRSSGTTYNATMTMAGPNTLRVEACAFWHFFCSRNNWVRMPVEHDKVITSREAAARS
jgi:Uncharacterized protein conserved in bacteria (DUF2147)